MLKPACILREMLGMRVGGRGGQGTVEEIIAPGEDSEGGPEDKEYSLLLARGGTFLAFGNWIKAAAASF